MRNATDAPHVPVLLEESLAALAIREEGVYVDGTFGRGGHARAILASLGEHGKLVAVDRDPDAEAAAAAIADHRFVFRRAWFSELPEVLDALAIPRIDGSLLDLGVSSPQLDDPARGRRIASLPSLKTDLRNAGAECVDQDVVTDGNLVSSRKPDDIPAFNRGMIALFSRARA